MTAPIQPLLRLEDVKKVFYTDEVETHALAGTHLNIQPGEYVSITGPSGCGKSTLLSIWACSIRRATASTGSTIAPSKNSPLRNARASATAKSASSSRASISSAT